jgi:hypothetical protein
MMLCSPDGSRGRIRILIQNGFRFFPSIHGVRGYGYDNGIDSNTLEEVVVVIFYTIMEGGIGRAASQIHI